MPLAGRANRLWTASKPGLSATVVPREETNCGQDGEYNLSLRERYRENSRQDLASWPIFPSVELKTISLEYVAGKPAQIKETGYFSNGPYPVY